MHKPNRYSLKWLVAIALAVAVPIGPAAADNYKSITLRVPVKVKNMVPEAERLRVQCSVSGVGGGLGAVHSAPHNIVNGEFDQIIEVVVTPYDGKNFLEAKTFVCRLEIGKSDGAWNAPRKETPTSNDLYDLYRLAKPNEFFQAIVNGPLAGGPKFVDGIVGADDLAVEPKQKQ